MSESASDVPGYFEQQYRRLVFLSEVSDCLRQSRNVEVALPQLAQHFTRRLDGERTFILWPSNLHAQQCEWKAYTYPGQQTSLRLKAIPTVLQEVLRDLVSEMFPPGTDTSAIDDFAKQMMPQLRCYLWLPVVVNNRLFAAILLVSTQSKEEDWSRDKRVIADVVEKIGDGLRRELFSGPVFVAHPFRGFTVDDFRDTLNRVLPLYGLRAVYGDTEIRTGVLLAKLRAQIESCPFGLYDISSWNPNVTLEFGVAFALKRPCLLLLDIRHKRSVPSDLGGLDRIEYDSMRVLEAELKNKLPSFLALVDGSAVSWQMPL